jgi:hypothetical protein
MRSRPFKKKQKPKGETVVERVVEYKIMVVVSPPPQPEKKSPRLEWLKDLGSAFRWLLRAVNATAVLLHKHDIWQALLQLWNHWF